MDWHEYYSNIKVESWVYMWVQAFCTGRGGWIQPPIYQHYLPGSYTIGCRRRYTGDRRTVDGGAFVDFAWLPPDKRSVKPTILLEVDENAHSSAGWDAERYRELFVFREIRREYRQSRSIVLIRLNPHEYKDKERVHGGGEPNVFTTEPSRDTRMAQVGQIIMWALGRPGSNPNIPKLRDGITIFFCYYDKWYMDAPNDPAMPIHMHHYRDLEAYARDVDAASGKNIPIQNRKIFLNPVWWDFDGAGAGAGAGGRRDTETTVSLNPFTPLPRDVRERLTGMLHGDAPAPVPAPAPAPAPAPVPAPRRNPNRRARPPRGGGGGGS